MTNKKDDQVKIEVSTYNWGPCVVKVKILDDFKKVLLEEAKKNEEDYASKLAGQIRKETGYSEESRGKIIPYLSPYLGVYDVAFQRYQNKEYEFGKPEYALTALWCNYQRQYEFNPPHDHDGKLSFVIYLSIPDPLKKENYEDIYWCIVTDQVPAEIINEYFEDKNFYRYYLIRRGQDER